MKNILIMIVCLALMSCSNKHANHTTSTNIVTNKIECDFKSIKYDCIVKHNKISYLLFSDTYQEIELTDSTLTDSKLYMGANFEIFPKLILNEKTKESKMFLIIKVWGDPVNISSMVFKCNNSKEIAIMRPRKEEFTTYIKYALDDNYINRLKNCSNSEVVVSYTNYYKEIELYKTPKNFSFFIKEYDYIRKNISNKMILDI